MAISWNFILFFLFFNFFYFLRLMHLIEVLNHTVRIYIKISILLEIFRVQKVIIHEN